MKKLTVWMYKFIQSLNFKLLYKGYEGVPTQPERYIDWYHALGYEIMKHDGVRNHAYRQAIACKAKNKTIVEIGTGDSLFLTRMCVESGAKKVYAIESDARSYASSKQSIERLNLEEYITLYEGWSFDISLPEKCDLLVHELVGCVGGDEGMIAIVEDAKRRFLQPNAEFIPNRCISKIAPCAPFQISIFDKIANKILGMGEERVGKNCSTATVNCYHVSNFPPRLLIARPQAIENILFAEEAVLKEEKAIEFAIDRPAQFNGVVAYIELFVDRDRVINTLYQKTNWSVIYLKLFATPIPVDRGDTIEVLTQRDVSTTNAEYHFCARVKRSTGGSIVSPRVRLT